MDKSKNFFYKHIYDKNTVSIVSGIFMECRRIGNKKNSRSFGNDV